MLRADHLLTAAIALVALLVLALVLVLGAGERLYREAGEQRIETRNARNAAIAFANAEADAVGAQRSYLIGGGRSALEAFGVAKQETLDRLDDLRQHNQGQDDSLAIVTRISDLTARLFDNLDAGIATSSGRARGNAALSEITQAIDSETEALHASIVRRADISRAHEEAERARINSLAGALALFSLITSALAILALRRERLQWQLATEAAEEARARAHASDLAKTRFLAVASHDMRQPLHALTLYLSALERRVEGDEARDIITKMDRATQSMVGMFSTLLDLARIQAGVVKPEFESVCVQHVIDRIVAEHPGSLVEAPPTSLAIRSDAILLERMLRNLVSNALKHGGGKARIETTARRDTVEIAVIDNGPGIAPEDQERIFDEFVRLEGRAEGLGLGLAIVKRIAQLLETPIDLISAPGQGARFVLHTERAAATPETQSKADTLASLNGAAILVVDDDALAREAVGRALSDLGADVRTASNEADAKEALQAGFAPRLLVMDLRIDGELAGVAIANRLREALAPAPHVIVVTGDTGPETLELLRASGYPWLIKPVSPDDLSEAAMAQLAA
jgi:signal transduction histidine kinase/ActR/RegA family two-component response regulator